MLAALCAVAVLSRVCGDGVAHEPAVAAADVAPIKAAPAVGDAHGVGSERLADGPAPEPVSGQGAASTSVDSARVSAGEPGTCRGMKALAQENERLRRLLGELQLVAGGRAPRGGPTLHASDGDVGGGTAAGRDPAAAVCSMPHHAVPPGLPAGRQTPRPVHEGPRALPLPASDSITDAAWIVTCSVAAACV